MAYQGRRFRMKSNSLPLTFKMLAIVGLSLVLGYQPSNSRAAEGDACEACDFQFWTCGGWQNDYCVKQLARCLYVNGCPPIDFVRGEAMPGMEAFVPVAKY
jgi:hypothetical protein